METLADLVLHIRQVSAGRPDLLSIKRGRQVERISTSDFLTGIHSLAVALTRRGVGKGDRVAIFAENCPEWHVVDFACQLLGAVSVPIYPNINAEQVGYILKNSGTRWVFFSDRPKAELLAAMQESLSHELVPVAIDHEARGEGDSLVLLQAEGAASLSEHPLERFRSNVEPDDLASLLYTSGTTGMPKGVMLSHRNFISNLLAVQDLFPISSEDSALSFLPLSHSFERTVDHLFFYLGLSIHYTPSIERVPPLLLSVKPTVLTSVPRLYERAYLKVTSQMAKEPPGKQKVFRWAMHVGRRYAKARRRGMVGPMLTLERGIADRLVFRKITERFGGRLRLAISGGAPLSNEVAEFFDAVGIQLYQGYGLTETAPVLTANRPGAERLGSVGPTVPGVEIRIADDGEILAQTPGLMQGYWGEEEATREVIDDQGWFHTGDVGHLDEDGFLFITDRKKDLLVTSGGKNVAPQPIEQKLITHPVIAQAIVIGDRYPYLTALLVPRYEELPEDLADRPTHELAEDSRLHQIVDRAVKEINEGLSDHERVRNWQLLPRELSLEAGEITPTLKVRRRVVAEKYADLISSMYLKTQKVPT